MSKFNNILGASILDADNKLETINKLINTGIKWIHYDIMDGDFVPNVSMSPSQVIELVRSTGKHVVDIHLMVKDIEIYVQKFQKIADYITVHFEAIDENQLNKIFQKYHNLKIGLALKPTTPLIAIKPYLSKLSHVLIMSVEPGLGGQKFIENTYEKISRLKHIIEQANLNLFIGIDGGINDKTGPKCIKSGANMLVSGSFLLNNLSKEIIKQILGK